MHDLTRATVVMEERSSKPLQCWGCGVDHKCRYFPENNTNPRSLHNIEGAVAMEDMARATPHICSLGRLTSSLSGSSAHSWRLDCHAIDFHFD